MGSSLSGKLSARIFDSSGFDMVGPARRAQVEQVESEAGTGRERGGQRSHQAARDLLYTHNDRLRILGER